VPAADEIDVTPTASTLSGLGAFGRKSDRLRRHFSSGQMRIWMLTAAIWAGGLVGVAWLVGVEPAIGFEPRLEWWSLAAGFMLPN